MRTFGGLCIALFLAAGVFAQQYRGNPAPVVTGGFGNIVHPAGTPSTVPGLTPIYTTVVNPGGGGPHFNVPYSPGGSRRLLNSTATLPYAYPVYVYTGLYDNSYAYGAQGGGQQQPNVTVVYPPQPAPVIINQFGPAAPGAAPGPPEAYQPPAAPDETTQTPEPAHYLIAFKDHTIYSAVAYWVDGDTLHYFTTPTTHNQVSMSLIDRDLTERLNRESGLELQLPPAK